MHFRYSRLLFLVRFHCLGFGLLALEQDLASFADDDALLSLDRYRRRWARYYGRPSQVLVAFLALK